MIRPRVRRLFRLRVRQDDILRRDLDEEIRAHLEERARRLEAGGLTPEEARAEAQRRFGPMEEARRELLRAARRRERRLGVREWLEGAGRDARHAWRGILREPGFAGVVVLVIALGVGANAAMFGILDRLLLRGPDHVRDSDRVARVYYTATVPGQGEFSSSTVGYVTYEALRDGVAAFDAVAAYSATDATLGLGDDAERVRLGHATRDFFPLLGVAPALGRFYGEEEDRPGAAHPVVVLGHGLWSSRFGRDSGVLGRTVPIQGDPYTVIGVAPEGFTGAELERIDAWVPMSVRGPGISEDWRTTWDAQWLEVVARLAPGVTAAAAGEEATRVFRAAYTGDEEPVAGARISARPLHHDETGGEALEVAVTRWLVAVSLIVLLVACANVANLLLARALRRRREVAVRLALGITRGRLVRLLLAESLVLALLGGAAALLVAPLVVRLVRATLLSNVAWTAPAVDGRVLAVAAALTLLTGILTGLAPALQAGRKDLVSSLKEGPREGGARGSPLRTGLTAAQAALSVLLLVGAGLFVRSLWNARTADLGVEPERVIAVSASWPRAPGETFAAREARRDAFYREALDRARRLRRVEAAAVAVGTPFHSFFQQRLRVPGRDSIPRLPGGGPYVQAVSPGYFETVGLELARGRVFETADREGSEPVAVVNRTMAATLWPGADALGECLFIGADDPPCARIVGVVEDAHRYWLEEEPAMQYYVPLGQERGIGGARLLIRAGDPATLLEPLRRQLRELDPEVLWLEVETLQQALDPQLRPWRLGATLIGALGALALLIAAVGLYSLVAYTVASRSHELGVRMALGAGRGRVLRLVLRRGLLVSAGGLAVGVGLALLAAPWVGDLLFGVSPRDPVVFASVVVALLAAATLASLIPARRATRLDPARALRAE